ncbi:MAG: N-acetyltransferase [Candidatus Rhabdochlamydia sp.]
MNLPCTIRLFQEEDEHALTCWLRDPVNLQWFPMTTEWEIQDAIRIWKGHMAYKSAFTAEYEGKAVGMGVLYLQPFEKLAHQCCFAIIVHEAYRNQGVGRALISHFEQQAQETFALQFLHLEVYENNPAIHLYHKMGFVELGRHPRFIKDNGVYLDKILMQKKLHSPKEF